MRAKLALSLVFLCQSVSNAADDPAIDKSSLFQRRARAIAELQVQELEKQAGIAAGEGVRASEPAATKRAQKVERPILIEIWGSGERLYATIRLPDGEREEVMPGDWVPGIGVIQAIRQTAVEDQFHHVYRVASTSEGLR